MLTDYDGFAWKIWDIESYLFIEREDVTIMTK
jgi:hypothetical protein